MCQYTYHITCVNDPPRESMSKLRPAIITRCSAAGKYIIAFCADCAIILMFFVPEHLSGALRQYKKGGNLWNNFLK
jgi:hypothetical protein